MAVTYNTLLSQLRYEDRQRERREDKERYESNANYTKFSSMAGDRVSAATGIASVARNETDIGKINKAIQKIEDKKTGVNFVDGVIDVSIDSLELRKRAVNTRNEIDIALTDLQASMGQGSTEGAKGILDDLQSQYVMMADNMVSANKVYLQDKLKSTREQFEYNLFKDEFDTDRKKQGYQLPSSFTDLDKEYFNSELRAKMDISEKTGSYTDVIADLKRSFPEMRYDRQSLGTAEAKVEAAKLKADAKIAEDIGKETDEFQLASDKRMLEGFKARLSGSKNTLGILANTNRSGGMRKAELGIAAGNLPTDITMAGTDPSGFNPDALINSIENSMLTLFTSKQAKGARDRTRKSSSQMFEEQLLDLDVGDVARQEEFEKIYKIALEGDYKSFNSPRLERERKAIIDLYTLRKDLLNFKDTGYPSAVAADPKETSSMGDYE